MVIEAPTRTLERRKVSEVDTLEAKLFCTNERVHNVQLITIGHTWARVNLNRMSFIKDQQQVTALGEIAANHIEANAGCSYDSISCMIQIGSVPMLISGWKN